MPQTAHKRWRPLALLATGLTAWMVVAASMGLGALEASAQQRPAVLVDAGLSGTLARVARSGVVNLGYREASVPFSYLDRAGRAVGYSIDLCQAIVEEIGRTLGRDTLKTEFVKVTSETRLNAVVEGKIDLECGSTTANAERSKLVSFSSLIFVAGTKVMVPRTTPWKDFKSLAGKKIAVTAGTTNQDALAKLDQKFHLGVTLVDAPDHEQAYQLLAEGKVDGFATDDVLLVGLLAHHKSEDKFKIVGELLSYDPYGIAYAHKDAPLKKVIERAFRRIVVENDLAPIYNKWFTQRLPTGERFNIPMSPQVEEAFAAYDSDLEPEDN